MSLSISDIHCVYGIRYTSPNRTIGSGLNFMNTNILYKFIKLCIG